MASRLPRRLKNNRIKDIDSTGFEVDRRELDLCFDFMKESDKSWTKSVEVLTESVRTTLCELPCDQCFEWASAALSKWIESPVGAASSPWWPDLGLLS